MNKTELIAKIAEEAHLTKAEAERALNAFLGIVEVAMAGGTDINITGFGSFKVVATKGGIRRNPQTGAEIQVAPGRKVKFVPGKGLKLVATAERE